MTRIIFNVGKGKEISKKDIIELLTSSAGRRDLDIVRLRFSNVLRRLKLTGNLRRKLSAK
jgi:hypothetical protein